MIRDYRNWSETNQTAGRRRSDTPNERWQCQQKTAWAKLARSEALDQRVEDFAQQMITEHSPAQKSGAL
jgi:hypothetical protein